MANIREIKMAKLQQMIRDDIEDGDYNPLMVFGKAGVGKTECLKSIAASMGIGYKEVRLITMSEIDMYGLPTIVEVPVFDQSGQVIEGQTRRVTVYVTPGMFPDARSDGEVGILVLDEITSCQPQVRAAAYQLLDVTRGLGEYRLPEKWKVIAIGNGEEDGGVFNGMESAFVSRAMTYRVEPDFASWSAWAVENGVNSAIIAFLKHGFMEGTGIADTDRSVGLLHRFDEDDVSSPFPCPRTWKKLSDKLNRAEKRVGKGKVDIEDVEIYAGGAVGEMVAAQFAAFYAYSKNIINPDDVLAGKENGANMKNYNTQESYLIVQSVVSALARELDADPHTNGVYSEDSVNKTANVCNWVVQVAENARLDYALDILQTLNNNVKGFVNIVLMDDLMSDESIFDKKCPGFLDFANKHSIVLGGAV